MIMRLVAADSPLSLLTSYTAASEVGRMKPLPGYTVIITYFSVDPPS
jgi:hypothetical protein